MLAHARRKFFEAHATTQSPLATEAVARGQAPDDRLATRAAKSAPLLAELRTWLEKTQRRISGKSDLAGAIRYTLSRWEALTLILRDGRTCIDNNAAERSMRPIAAQARMLEAA
jgi:transposase